jgi:rubrerythrin
MATLKGSKTHENLKAAFANEAQANRRYLYSQAIPREQDYFATRRKAKPVTRMATWTICARLAIR